MVDIQLIYLKMSVKRLKLLIVIWISLLSTLH